MEWPLKTLPTKMLDHGKDTEYNQKLINCSMLSYSGKLTVIQIDGLPSKYISLIMTGYNLTDWSSIIVMCHH